MNETFEMNDCKVKIIPLGGLEQIGMNMTAIEYDDTIIVMDCGKIVQRGTHEELSQVEGHYQRLIQNI